MNQRQLIRLIGLLLILVMVGGVSAQSEGEAGALRNPLNPYGGADPWLTYYDGNYYLAATTWASEWTMRKSPTLAGLKTAEPVQIYFETDPSRCCNFWAPEFRLFAGDDGQPHWYFYYTAGTAGTYDHQHPHVLESEGDDPLGPYHYKSSLLSPEDESWAIDGSVLDLDGALYFLFSAFTDGPQSIYIAPMSNPWTISGERVLLSQPTYAWELSGNPVNEGPVALQHDGTTFVVFSASACTTPDYKLGMLTLTGDDPLDRASWVKRSEPVFQRSDANDVYGPGHNGFFTSPDGTEDWIVYHAVDFAGGACDGRRTTRVQRFAWNADGTPNFGVPVSTDTVIAAPSGDLGVDPLPELAQPQLTRFQSYDYPSYYLRHANFVFHIDPTPNPLADSQFVVVPGLADSAAISIQSYNFPGFYLRQFNNVIVLASDDGTDEFAGSATWWQRPGIADSAALSFESYSVPGSYIGRKFGLIALVAESSLTTDDLRKMATFIPGIVRTRPSDQLLTLSC